MTTVIIFVIKKKHFLNYNIFVKPFRPSATDEYGDDWIIA